jgi:hypothetical protein
MQETVEDLESELEEALVKIDTIAAKVLDKEIDSYEGFMQSEMWKNKIVEIGHKLKERGIDITTRTE